MNDQTSKEHKQWIAITARILQEPQDRLQGLLLDISKQNPEMGFYAVDLARLRLAGKEMELRLQKLWQARTADSIDSIISFQDSTKNPAGRALAFLGALIKRELNGRGAASGGPSCHGQLTH